MKILMVNKYLCPKGGSETYIFKLGDYLNAHGHEVQFFGMDDTKRIVGNHIGSYSTNMDFHNGRKLSKLSYPIKVIYNTEACRKIRLVLDDFMPDILHLNNFSFQLTPSIILETVKWRCENNRKCRIIYTAHDYNLICPNHMMNNPNTKENCEKCLKGNYFNCTKNKCIHNSTARSLIGSIEAFFWNMIGTYKFIDVVICPSMFLKNKMDNNTIFKEKTVSIHNFIDTSETDNCPKKDYVLYFGKYTKEKGINTLVNVCKNLPEIKFIFAGAGPQESLLNNINNIENVGFQTGDDLKQLISEARFCVCPSEWYENCPFSVMESIMYGTPVIGAAIGGIPELISEGETGELFTSGSETDLMQKIESLWDDKSRNEEYSKNCKNASFLTISQYCKILIEEYEHGPFPI